MLARHNPRDFDSLHIHLLQNPHPIYTQTRGLSEPTATHTKPNQI